MTYFIVCSSEKKLSYRNYIPVNFSRVYTNFASSDDDAMYALCYSVAVERFSMVSCY